MPRRWSGDLRCQSASACTRMFADRRRIGRPGHHRQPGRVGHELVEQVVARAAAHDVQHLDLLPHERFQPRQRLRVRERQAFQHDAHDFRRRARHHLGRSRGSRRRSSPSCRPARGNAGRRGMMWMFGRTVVARHLDQLAIGVGLPHRAPRAPAFLQQPKSHAVAQKPDRARPGPPRW